MKPIRWKRIELTYLACIQLFDCVKQVCWSRFWPARLFFARSSSAFASGVRRIVHFSGWIVALRSLLRERSPGGGKIVCCVLSVVSLAYESAGFVLCFRKWSRATALIVRCAVGADSQACFWRKSRSSIRPVLKHGPRSLANAQVIEC